MMAPSRTVGPTARYPRFAKPVMIPSRTSRSIASLAPSIPVKSWFVGASFSTDDQNVAGQVLDQFAQLLGLSVLLARFEHQEAAVELDDPLPQGGRFGRGELGLKAHRMSFEEKDAQ